MVISEDEIKNLTLCEIENLLSGRGQNLQNFPTMSFPTIDFTNFTHNKLLLDELSYDCSALANEHVQLLSQMTEEQKNVYSEIMKLVNSSIGRILFVYGYDGTGKTFLWKVLSSAIRCKGQIVLNVASSRIALLLLPGGRTAHSRFDIPFNPTQNSSCEIKQQSPLAELIISATLIIWDEAFMTNKYCFEVVDNSLRSLMSVDDSKRLHMSFGGKAVIFWWRFSSILSVVVKGSRHDIVNTTINSSRLWKYCTLLRLTKNMRLCNTNSIAKLDELEMFSKWIVDIGDGKIGVCNDGCDIPDDLILHILVILWRQMLITRI